MKYQLTFATVLVILYQIGSAAGGRTHGRCTKFSKTEKKPDLENGEYYCIHDQEFKYCRNYTCPDPGCESPLAPTDPTKKCKYCPGTCSYGGSTYKVGEGFDCLDGSNRCFCGKNNMIGGTLMAIRPDWMCKVTPIL